MRGFLTPILIALIALSPVHALAGLPPTTLKGELGSKKTTFNLQAPLNQATQVSGTTSVIETGSDNALANPRFAGGTTGWTASGGTFTAASNTGTWDSSAASQTLTSTAVTVTTGDIGKNQAWSASCRFLAASGTATHKIQLYDGTNVLAETTITSSTDYARSTATGIAPSSGSVSLRIISVASNEPSIDIKNCYLGRAEGFNWAQVSQATFYGSVTWPGTASCAWSRTSNATFGGYSADSDCTTPTGGNVVGNASAPATKIPAIRFQNMAVGEYRLVATGSFYNASASGNCSWRFSDGTNATKAQELGGAVDMRFPNIVGHLSVTSPGDKTIEIQATGATGNFQCDIQNSVATTRDLTIMAYRYPTSTEGAVRGDVSGARATAYHDKDCAWSTVSTSLTDPSDDASCTFAVRNSTNLTLSSAGAKSPAITFTPPKAGVYHVCAHAALENATANNGVAISLTDGTNVLGTGISFDGTNTLGGIPKTTSACGDYYATSTSSVTLKLQLAASGTGTAFISNGNVTGTAAIEWEVELKSGNQPQPLIPGSVFSSSAGTERLERAKITVSASTCTVNSQSGSWVSSCTSSGTGAFSMTLGSSFSSLDTCTGSSLSAGSDFPRFSTVSGSTVAGTIIKHDGTAEDGTISVICMGPH